MTGFGDELLAGLGVQVAVVQGVAARGAAPGARALLALGVAHVLVLVVHLDALAFAVVAAVHRTSRRLHQRNNWERNREYSETCTHSQVHKVHSPNLLKGNVY